MSYMFYGAYDFDRDIGSWDVSGTVQSMFYEARSFNRDIGSWDVSGVTTMQSMFGHAYAFNQDIRSWDTSAVTGALHVLLRPRLQPGHRVMGRVGG